MRQSACTGPMSRMQSTSSRETRRTVNGRAKAGGGRTKAKPKPKPKAKKSTSPRPKAAQSQRRQAKRDQAWAQKVDDQVCTQCCQRVLAHRLRSVCRPCGATSWRSCSRCPRCSALGGTAQMSQREEARQQVEELKEKRAAAEIREELSSLRVGTVHKKKLLADEAERLTDRLHHAKPQHQKRARPGQLEPKPRKLEVDWQTQPRAISLLEISSPKAEPAAGRRRLPPDQLDQMLARLCRPAQTPDSPARAKSAPRVRRPLPRAGCTECARLLPVLVARPPAPAQ